MLVTSKNITCHDLNFKLALFIFSFGDYNIFSYMENSTLGTVFSIGGQKVLARTFLMPSTISSIPLIDALPSTAPPALLAEEEEALHCPT